MLNLQLRRYVRKPVRKRLMREKPQEEQRTHLQRGEHQRFFLGAIDFTAEQTPLGLFVYLIDAHGVQPGVQVVERVELESQFQQVVLSNALFHDRQRRIQPSVAGDEKKKKKIIETATPPRRVLVFRCPVCGLRRDTYFFIFFFFAQQKPRFAVKKCICAVETYKFQMIFFSYSIFFAYKHQIA